MPVGRADDDDLYLALAAAVMSGMDLGDEPPEDELSALRRRHREEHAMARSRHPSARKRSA